MVDGSVARGAARSRRRVDICARERRRARRSEARESLRHHRSGDKGPRFAPGQLAANRTVVRRGRRAEPSCETGSARRRVRPRLHRVRALDGAASLRRTLGARGVEYRGRTRTEPAARPSAVGRARTRSRLEPRLQDQDRGRLPHRAPRRRGAAKRRSPRATPTADAPAAASAETRPSRAQDDDMPIIGDHSGNFDARPARVLVAEPPRPPPRRPTVGGASILKTFTGTRSARSATSGASRSASRDSRRSCSWRADSAPRSIGTTRRCAGTRWIGSPWFARRRRLHRRRPSPRSPRRRRPSPHYPPCLHRQRFRHRQRLLRRRPRPKPSSSKTRTITVSERAPGPRSSFAAAAETSASPR